MFKVNLIVVLFLCHQGKSEQLCSVRKANNKCICRRVTDVEQNLVVTVADCARVGLTYFPNGTQLEDDLNVLDLSHNDIMKLDSDCDFSSVTLETLLLSYNNIGSISEAFFNNTPNLQKLILSHNNITSLEYKILQNLKKLQSLHLSFNNIKTIQDNAFQPLQVLQVLDLSYNDKSLGVWLTDNMSSKLGLNTNIFRLKLDNIGLTELSGLHLVNYTNLKYLSLADNHFESFPNLPYSVEYLDLSGADISTVQAKYLNYHSLKILKMNRMKKLESIHHYAFYNLQALEELSINDCPNLKEFSELTFGLLSKNITLPLQTLSLSRNSLTTLNDTYHYLFRTLKHIDLRDNPWNCNCRLLWMQEFDKFYKEDDIICFSPSVVASKSLFDVTDSDLPSCHPEKYGKRSHKLIISVLILLVIALSGLVGYLIFYGPNSYGGRVKGVGPHSPYSPTRMEE